ncbi:MAG: hypothetical protein LVQ97_00445 [Candidatus Micrarchaeales archaeon]|jgi:hypothetical protein|nr:hypothetical protein [Candidatus Micrarchaeales archaeon]
MMAQISISLLLALAVSASFVLASAVFFGSLVSGVHSGYSAAHELQSNGSALGAPVQIMYPGFQISYG